MLKRILFVSIGILVVYVYFVTSKAQFGVRTSGGNLPEKSIKKELEEAGKIYNFEFTKYSPTGEKELEIQGESADMFAKIVELQNVIAKAYQEDTPITVTADEGKFDRENTIIYLKKNVVATTDDGGRLLSDTLDVYPQEKKVETESFVEVFKDTMHLQGIGTESRGQLEQIQFFRDIKVVFSKENEENVVITCDGPLFIDYKNNFAKFQKNVISIDPQGTMKSDDMDVYYDRETRQADKIYATGDVVLEQDGNKTFSDSVVYLVQEGRAILEGDHEAFGMPAQTDAGFGGEE